MAKEKYTGRFTKQSVKARSTNTERKPVQPKQTSSAPNTVVTAFIVLALCVSIFASVFFLTKLGVTITLPSRYIANGVTVADVDVGGLTRKQAIAAVTEAIGDSYSSTPLVVKAYDQQMEITPEVSGASLDVKAAVKEAARYGTEKNPAKTVDIIPYLNLNTDAINEQIRNFSLNFPSEGVDGTYEITTETVEVEGEETEQAVLTTTIGSPFFDFDGEELYDIIENAYNEHQFEATYDC